MVGAVFAFLLVFPAGHTTWAWSAEVNTFGTAPHVMKVVIYRDRDGTIVAWRWWHVRFVPRSQGRPRWLVARFEERGIPRTVYVRSVFRTRTAWDQELVEQRFWPASRRRGLR